MNTKVIILALTLALTACGADDRPDDLIPTGTMAQILHDVHLGEQRVSQLGLHSQDSSLVVYHQLEKRIYKKYNVDTATYRRSYLYYASQPKLYQEIYKAVIDSLQAEERRVSADSSANRKRVL
ncbi:MAG: DUF4296 domain-containing protein [Cytophagaceae bacterium]|nr:DUF4296 domain-containing protein [Cytophagaceae bacterium]